VTEIENFRKLTHLNQFSRQKHTHARVSVILPQLQGTTGRNTRNEQHHPKPRDDDATAQQLW
jgi:hypothetical protein